MPLAKHARARLALAHAGSMRPALPGTAFQTARAPATHGRHPSRCAPRLAQGHLDLIEELEAAEAQADGLWVCGNYRSGVAFPDCVEFGYQQAKVVSQYLAAH